MNVLDLKNIREAVPFPRDMERIDIRLATKKPQVQNQGVFEKIIKLLQDNKINYQLFEHEPVYTSEEAAKVRGTKIEQGAKALVMIADKKPIMLVTSAAKKVDTKKFKEAFGVGDLRMATAEEVKDLTGVEIGAVPPFAHLFELPLYVDQSLGKNEKIVFNAGLHTKSIKMSYQDYRQLTKPTSGSFSVPV